MIDDDTVSLLAAHASAQSLLARLRAKGAECRVWLSGSARRLEERMDRVELLVCGSMPLSAEEIGSGFQITVANPEEEGWALIECTGGSAFLTEMEETRRAIGLPWPLPDKRGERELVEETFGEYVPPWLRSDRIDRSDPPYSTGDMLIVPRVTSSAKSEVVSYLDTVGGSVFVVDDGGSVASILAMLGKRMDDPRVKLSTIVSKASNLQDDRGTIVILDATSMSGAEQVCAEIDKLREITEKPVLLLNPTGRKPSNDMLGHKGIADEIAQKCASARIPLLVCGHPARLSPGDDEVAAFIAAGCHIALGSGGSRPDRCKFGLDCATAMAARAGAKSRDIWDPSKLDLPR